MSDEATLLPCPFCGCTVIYVTHTHYYDDEDTVCMFCNGCKSVVILETNEAEGINDKTKAEAIDAWNARAPVEYDGWFYLPKPKESIVQYGEQRTKKTEHGYKVTQSVEAIESAIRSWGDELGDYIMKRICEIWNTRATHGTLTAAQVRDTVEKHWHDLSAEYDMPEATALPDYSYDWQAIADELNAELGGGTCEWATDCEGVRIDVADTVHMLRSEYDGDHEWDDVVIELAYCKHGGDRWIVRGARGEALACDCTVTGHDDELYDKSDDWDNLPTPWDAPEPDGWHKCPECGCTVGYTELRGGGWSIMMDDYQIPYNNCPKCGRPILVCDVEVER